MIGYRFFEVSYCTVRDITLDDSTKSGCMTGIQQLISSKGSIVKTSLNKSKPFQEEALSTQPIKQMI